MTNIDTFVSPSKHPLINTSEDNYSNDDTSNEETKKNKKNTHKNKRISSKLSKIIIENTPTPFLNSKFKTSKIQSNKQNNFLTPANVSNNPKSNLITNRRVIPNTPTAFGASATKDLVSNGLDLTNNKKVKKLLNLNRFDELELQDEVEAENVNPKSTNGGEKKSSNSKPKVSNLFKPKLSHGNTNEDMGSDLSFESLQKRQRKNQFVVRKSEVFKNAQDKLPPIAQFQRNEDNLPKIDINSLNQQPNDSNQNISDYTDNTNQINLNSTQSNPAKIIQHSSMSCTPIFNKSTSLMMTKCNQEFSTTFTKITRQIDSLDSDNENSNRTNQSSNKNSQENLQTSFFSNIVIEERKCEPKSSDQLNNNEELDMILFDGIKIDDDDDSIIKTKSKKIDKNVVSTKSNVCFSDKTNLFTHNNLSNNYHEKMNNFRYDDANNSKKFLSKTKIKKYNFTFINFSTQKEAKLRRIVMHLMDNEATNEKKEKIKAVISQKYHSNTTHLLMDFQETFEQENNDLNTLKMYLLILAIINKCKLVRYEWLIHCNNKNKWLDTTDYSLDAYVGNDLYDLDQQDDFDIKLAKLVRKVENASLNRKLLSSLKNVFIMNDEYMKENKNDSNNNTNQSNLSIFKDFFATSASNFNSIHDILIELMTKFGAHITSRVNCSSMIIAVDKTYDYDENNQSDLDRIEEDKLNFLKSIKKYKNLIRKKNGVEIISSNWLINCILDNSLLDKDEYLLEFIYPNKK